jgi:hypothetical protein
MGSWNNTCGLTNLPIHAGEAVYVFPIKEKDLSKYRSHCYSTALYKPVLIPFVAEYNDYGAGENCQGIALDLIVEELRRELVELEVGENQYHDIAVKRDEFDVDKFFEAVHEDRLFVRGWGETDRPVYFTMVRKDVVDRMWNEWQFDMWKGSKTEAPAGFESDQYYIKNVTYAKLFTLIPEFLKSAARAFNELDQDSRIRARFFSKNLLIMEAQENFPILESTFRAFENFEQWDLLNGRECIIRFIESGDLEQAEEFMRHVLIGEMVNSMMSSTRRVWLPVMHQGSQSEEHAEYRFLHRVSNDVIDARDAEMAAYNDEADDDLFSNVGIYLLRDRIENDS